jgi:NitT/TauT family transport system ATP-binding protein
MMPGYNDVLIHVVDVYKRYGDKMVLDNIDLSVKPGEFCTVVGPSGCGKSTLLRLILGQERPTAGEVIVKGKESENPNSHRGIVYQKYSLFPNLTVFENVMLGKKLNTNILKRVLKRKEIKEEVMYYLEKVGMSNHVYKKPRELSGGMQQRVSIAQSLIMKPRILLMDEPFGALDSVTREHMQLVISELWEQTKMTIFFVTHDLEEAVYLGTRLLVLSQFYTDDRETTERGAKIRSDYKLRHRKDGGFSTKIKETGRFGKLIQQIRHDCDPKYLKHVDKFNLKHPDSWQTLTIEESKKLGTIKV